MVIRLTQALALGLLLVGCSTTRVEEGVFYSAKGYQVRLPQDGWRVQPGGKADLELRRATPPGGMLVDATCEGKELGRTLPVLARHLTFGLSDRVTVENTTQTVAGLQAAQTVVRGSLDGAPVAVEAFVFKGARCVHDFLYVAPVGEFEAGRRDFRVLVESFTGEMR